MRNTFTTTKTMPFNKHSWRKLVCEWKVKNIKQNWFHNYACSSSFDGCDSTFLSFEIKSCKIDWRKWKLICISTLSNHDMFFDSTCLYSTFKFCYLKSKVHLRLSVTYLISYNNFQSWISDCIKVILKLLHICE